MFIGCNAPEAHKAIKQRYRSGTELYATRKPSCWSIRGPLYVTHYRCSRLKAYHEIETMIRIPFGKKGNGQLMMS
ncbi:Pol polyprotein [Schistosoma japonicum]|nr:Pol polyprotein [Schistosoma japonicum]